MQHRTSLPSPAGCASGLRHEAQQAVVLRGRFLARYWARYHQQCERMPQSYIDGNNCTRSFVGSLLFAPCFRVLVPGTEYSILGTEPRSPGPPLAYAAASC